MVHCTAGSAPWVATPCHHGCAFLGLAEGKSLWGGSGWGWGTVGTGDSRTPGRLGSSKHVSKHGFKSKGIYREEK